MWQNTTQSCTRLHFLKKLVWYLTETHCRSHFLRIVYLITSKKNGQKLFNITITVLFYRFFSTNQHLRNGSPFLPNPPSPLPRIAGPKRKCLTARKKREGAWVGPLSFSFSSFYWLVKQGRGRNLFFFNSTCWIARFARQMATPCKRTGARTSTPPGAWEHKIFF